jgi:hypothetical protein
MGFFPYFLLIDRFVFENTLFDQHNRIPDIDASRTYQHAFATEHALLNFGLKLTGFAPTQGKANPAYIKTNQVVGTAGGSASPARKTGLKRRFCLKDIDQQTPIELIVINRTLFNHRVTKVLHLY